jgi:predicted dehydrogenase
MTDDQGGAAREGEPVAVGLVGAGPWARMVHAPLLANHPRTTLAGVWARRPEAAAEVAAPHGAPAFERYDELLERCDAVAFAVPPDVQAEHAAPAARAGKALLLEKPIGLDLDQAQRLVDVVDEAGVLSMLFLTWRYAAATRAFLDEVAAAEPIGGRGRFISGGLLAGPFTTPWRLCHGALLDVGPHIIDVLDAALGPVVGIRAHGDPLRWVGLLLDHENGLASEVSLSSHTAVLPPRNGVEIYTAAGPIDLDAASSVTPDTFVTIAGELAETVTTGTPHPLDIHRGLHLQRLLDAAAADIRSH